MQSDQFKRRELVALIGGAAAYPLTGQPQRTLTALAVATPFFALGTSRRVFRRSHQDRRAVCARRRTDLIARTLAQEMAKDTGGPMIVENKPGAPKTCDPLRARGASLGCHYLSGLRLIACESLLPFLTFSC